MKRLITYGCMLMAISAWAQQDNFSSRIGLVGGLDRYVGDIDQKFSDVDWTNSGVVALNFQKFIGYGAAIYGQVGFVRLSGNDLDNNNFTRALNFRTEAQTVELGFRFYTDNGKLMRYNARLSPFFALGAGYGQYNVFGDLYYGNGQRYNYWSDGTIHDLPENDPNAATSSVIQQDGDFETELTNLLTEDNKPSSANYFFIPAQIGLKWRVSDRIAAEFIYGFNWTFTDHLDDISAAEYYNGPELDSELQYISDPTGKIAERGNPNDNDHYHYAAIGLSWSFNRRSSDYRVNPVYIDRPSQAYRAAQDSLRDAAWERLENERMEAEYRQFVLDSLEALPKPVIIKVESIVVQKLEIDSLVINSGVVQPSTVVPTGSPAPSVANRNTDTLMIINDHTDSIFKVVEGPLDPSVLEDRLEMSSTKVDSVSIKTADETQLNDTLDLVAPVFTAPVDSISGEIDLINSIDPILEPSEIDPLPMFNDSIVETDLLLLNDTIMNPPAPIDSINLPEEPMDSLMIDGPQGSLNISEPLEDDIQSTIPDETIGTEPASVPATNVTPKAIVQPADEGSNSTEPSNERSANDGGSSVQTTPVPPTNTVTEKITEKVVVVQVPAPRDETQELALKDDIKALEQKNLRLQREADSLALVNKQHLPVQPDATGQSVTTQDKAFQEQLRGDDEYQRQTEAMNGLLIERINTLEKFIELKDKQGNDSIVNVMKGRISSLDAEVRMLRDSLSTTEQRVRKGPVTNGISVTKPDPANALETKPEKGASARPVPSALAVVDSVFFRSESFYVNAKYRQSINIVAQELNTAKHQKILVTGHSDSSGDAPYNLILSEKRARAVADQLIIAGVPAASLVIRGMGEQLASGKFDRKERNVVIQAVLSTP